MASLSPVRSNLWLLNRTKYWETLPNLDPYELRNLQDWHDAELREARANVRHNVNLKENEKLGVEHHKAVRKISSILEGRNHPSSNQGRYQDWPDEWPDECPSLSPVYGRKEKNDSPPRHYKLAKRPSLENLKKIPGSSSSSTPSYGMLQKTPGSSSNTTPSNDRLMENPRSFNSIPHHAKNLSPSSIGWKTSQNGIKEEHRQVSQSGESTPESDDSIELLFHNNKSGPSASSFETALRKKLEKQKAAEQQIAQEKKELAETTRFLNEYENRRKYDNQRPAAPFPVKKEFPPQYDGTPKEPPSDLSDGSLEMITPEQFQASANRALKRSARARPAYHGMLGDEFDGLWNNNVDTMHRPPPYQLQNSPSFINLLNRQPNPQFPQYPTYPHPSLAVQQPPPDLLSIPGAYPGGNLLTPPANPTWDFTMVPQATNYGNPNDDVDFDSEVELVGSVVRPERSMRDMYDALETHGLAYMANDPSKKKEEIESLLANIRPDQELPADMTQGNPEGLKVNLMTHQKLGLTWLLEQEKGSNRGGILADDMGLGKTIQALSLILSNPSEDESQKTTLIIAPVALMQQWEKEIHDKVKSDHRLKVFIYHGAKKNNMTFAKLSKFDVVLTTFGNLVSEQNQKDDHELIKDKDAFASLQPPENKLIGGNCKWYRIIIDEAQNIKNPRTKSSLAATHLFSKYRLCMTGTPMMNHVGELYSLIRFLRIKPYNQLERFNSTFMKPLKSPSDEARSRAMEKLQILIKAIMLRRTKESKINDEPILNLPDRNTVITHASFNEHQEELYRGLEKRSSVKFNQYLKAGTVLNNYSYILVLLLRLRQACCHPHLIPDLEIPIEGEPPPEKMESLARDLSESAVNMIKAWLGALECPICYDATDSPLIFYPCGHGVCQECFVRLTEDPPARADAAQARGFQCPQCRNHIEASKMIKYSIFQKVHMPEQYAQANGLEVLSEAPPESSDSSDSEDDFDQDEIDTKGNLKGFVVGSDEESEDDDSNDYISTQKDSKKRTRGPKVRVKKEEKAPAKKKKKKLTLAELKKESMRNKGARVAYMKRLRKGFKSSAKIDKAVEILTNIQNDDPTEKTIVFSQFTTLLDLVEVPLLDRGWGYRRYDGGMSPKDRNKAVEDFFNDSNVKVMLVSLKAGNAGLNLNKASQVIILDPFWNPFIEEQAIDRAHRIGQLRDVHIHRVLVENTVEDRIMKLQEDKRALIGEALDEGKGQSLSRLGKEELVYLFVGDKA